MSPLKLLGLLVLLVVAQAVIRRLYRMVSRRIVRKGPYRGNGFTIEVPGHRYKLFERKQDQHTFIDFVVPKNQDGEETIYSIEIAQFTMAESDDAFLKNWGNFLPRYLTGNFGANGRYRALFTEANPEGLAPGTFLFAGSGTHNDGTTGSIIGAARNLGIRVLTFYVLTGKTRVLPESAIKTTPEYQRFMAFYRSFHPKGQAQALNA